MKLLMRPNNLHYFPSGILNETNEVYMKSVEKLKEHECSITVNLCEPVKACKLWLYKKGCKTKIVSFNASDIPVIALFSIIYSDIQSITAPKYGVKDYYAENRKEMFDVDDALHDIIDEINKEKIRRGKSSKKEKNINFFKIITIKQSYISERRATCNRKKRRIEKGRWQVYLWQNKCKLMDS